MIKKKGNMKKKKRRRKIDGGMCRQCANENWQEMFSFLYCFYSLVGEDEEIWVVLHSHLVLIRAIIFLIYTLKAPAIAPIQSKLSLNHEPRESLSLIIKWVKLQQHFLRKTFYMLTNAPKSFFTFDLLPRAIHSLSQHHSTATPSRKFSIVFFFCWISSALNERYLDDRNRIVYSRAIFILLRTSEGCSLTQIPTANIPS